MVNAPYIELNDCSSKLYVVTVGQITLSYMSTVLERVCFRVEYGGVVEN